MPWRVRRGLGSGRGHGATALRTVVVPPARRSHEERSPAAQGAWLLSLRGRADPEELTAALLDRFAVDESVWIDPSQRHDLQLRFGLFLNRWNRGLELPPALVSRIARVHARVIFDIYGPDGMVDVDEP